MFVLQHDLGVSQQAGMPLPEVEGDPRGRLWGAIEARVRTSIADRKNANAPRSRTAPKRSFFEYLSESQLDQMSMDVLNLTR